MALTGVTEHGSKPWTVAPAYAVALLVIGLSADGCDLTPIPVPQAGGGQVNSGGTSAGSTSTGGVAGSTVSAGGSGGAGAGAGATGTGGANGGSGGSPAGGSPAGGSGGSTAGGTGGAAPSGNLVTNGDFSQGDTPWHVTPYAGMETHSVVNGAFCVVLTQNGSVTVGWPMDLAPGFSLVAGTSYQFAYQASVNPAPTALTFSANIGPTAPGAAFFSVANDPVGTNLQTFQHTFQATTASSSAGIAFNILATAAGAITVCLDNVTLTAL